MRAARRLLRRAPVTRDATGSCVAAGGEGVGCGVVERRARVARRQRRHPSSAGNPYSLPSTAHNRMAAAIPNLLSNRPTVSGEKSTASFMTKGLKFCLNVQTCDSPIWT